MNAPANIQADNLALWKALATTDPKHTKTFKRAGGFSGTAIKPIWIIQRLTEQFGPVGMGWGMGRPHFETIPGHNHEVLVFCTVECWHTHPDNTFVGVGGDKVVTHIKENKQYNRPERWENDDEAFKKAFTDAVGNAFKFIGIGSDVHMGLFDDSKYVRQAEREFAEREAVRDTAESAVSPDGAPDKHDARKNPWSPIYSGRSALHKGLVVHEAELNRLGVEGTLDDLDAYLTSPEYADFVKVAGEHMPHYLEGGPPAPPEFAGIFAVEQKARDQIVIRGNVPAEQEPA